MTKIAIVTDSSACIPSNLLTKYHISVAPLLLLWDNNHFEDGIDIQPVDFYAKLKASKSFPTTSQATVSKFTDIYSDLLNQGFQILTIVISSKLSGTLDSATQAARAFPDARIELIDSLTTSVPLQYLVLKAARAAKEGASIEECRSLVETAVSKIKVFFAVDTLTYLHKGGRINSASRFLGTALDLKPILELSDGKIEALEKVRTSKKAQARLLELIEKDLGDNCTPDFIGVISADADTASDTLLTQLRSRFNPVEFMVATLSPVLGAHTGPGTVGIAYLKT